MPKLYLETDVLTAARERMAFIFDRFERVIVSFSAGKDSTDLLHLAGEQARARGRVVDVLLIDLEGQYKLTIQHAQEMMVQSWVRPWWICLPLNLRNAVSSFEPFWCCWDPEQRDHWIRPMPIGPGVISDPHDLPFFRYRMEFEEFVVEFQDWLADGKLLACLVGIRADESLDRFRTMVKDRKSRFEGIPWSTVKGNTVSFYPIYDWGVEDVWTYVAREGLAYNRLYDKMWLAGETLHEMRICQPYGDDQRKGLDLFHKLEPETWFRVVQRVSGANYGARYCDTRFMGYRRGLGLPPGLTWKQYTKMLLASLPPHMAEHYKEKFFVFLRWWKNHRRQYDVHGVFDSGIKNPATGKNIPSWQRMALTILKDDYLCKSLKFAQTKRQHQKLEGLKDKYRNL